MSTRAPVEFADELREAASTCLRALPPRQLQRFRSGVQSELRTLDKRGNALTVNDIVTCSQNLLTRCVAVTSATGWRLQPCNPATDAVQLGVTPSAGDRLLQSNHNAAVGLRDAADRVNIEARQLGGTASLGALLRPDVASR